MNKNLNELILAKCRDQVAKRISAPYHEKGQTYSDWKEMEDYLLSSGNKMVLIERINEAALMAMEEVAGFMVWLSKECVPLTLSYCMEPKNQMYLETMYREYEEYGRVKQ